MAITRKDFSSLGPLLSLYSGKQLLVKLTKELATASLSDLVMAVSQIQDDTWREVSLNHLRALKAENCMSTYSFQLDLVQIVLRELLPKGDRSMLPVIYTLTADLWEAAVQSKKGEAEEEAARTINRAFTVCITDRSGLVGSRKHGCYKLLSLLMRIYFHRNQLNLCTQLLRALHTADMPRQGEFPKSHLVPFHYYNGRFLLSSGRFTEALEQLQTALRYTYSALIHGSETARGNMERVLRFYLAAHVACFPHQRPRIPDEYGGNHEILQCMFDLIANGKIAEYRNALSEYFDWLAKHELYVIFQRFEVIAIRNAIKRIHDSLESANRTKLPLQLIYNVADGAQVWPLGVDHLAAHLCGLISKGVIRGYVSLTPPYLVLSAKDPFPVFSL